MDHQNCGAVLHRSRLFCLAAEFLGEIRFISVAGGFEAKKEYACVVLAYRSGKRHSLAAKHRAEFALVLHRASRARPWVLFQGLHPPGSSSFAADRSRARIS